MGYSKAETLSLRKIGSRIRRFREAKGWSQEEFAFQADLHRNYVGGIERGERNVAILNMIKIAKVLEVSVGALFEES